MSPPRLVVIGETCAGKSTLGRFLHRRYGYEHIEASEIVQRGLARASGSSLDVDRFLAMKGRDFVAQSVISRFGLNASRPLVVTGMRLEEELATLSNAYDLLVVVWVEADREIRFRRYQKRRRRGLSRTLDSFMKEEAAQTDFRTLSKSHAEAVILNEGTFREYWTEAEVLLGLGQERHATVAG